MDLALTRRGDYAVRAALCLTMAAALGLGNGAVFALVGTRVPAARVGSVTGLVGAAGGLGDFLPPIVMGLVFTAWRLGR